MKRCFNACVFASALTLVLALFVSTVDAQGGRGGQGGQGGRGAGGQGGQGGRGGGGFGQGRGGFGGGSYIDLLRAETVREEVDVIEAQYEEIQAIQEEMGAKRTEMFADLRGGGGDVDMEAIRAKMTELSTKMKKDVEEVLLPHQVDRLKEIWIQSLGVTALTNEGVQKDLELSGTQKGKIEEINTAFNEKRREMFGGGRGGQGGQGGQGGRGGRGGQGGQGGGGGEDVRAQLTELTTTMEKDLMGVLDANQKGKFEDMKGEAFEGLDEIRNQGRGGRGGQGGQGGGARGGRGGQGGGGGRPNRDGDGDGGGGAGGAGGGGGR